MSFEVGNDRNRQLREVDHAPLRQALERGKSESALKTAKCGLISFGSRVKEWFCDTLCPFFAKSWKWLLPVAGTAAAAVSAVALALLFKGRQRKDCKPKEQEDAKPVKHEAPQQDSGSEGLKSASEDAGKPDTEEEVCSFQGNSGVAATLKPESPNGGAKLHALREIFEHAETQKSDQAQKRVIDRGGDLGLKHQPLKGGSSDAVPDPEFVPTAGKISLQPHGQQEVASEQQPSNKRTITELAPHSDMQPPAKKSVAVSSQESPVKHFSIPAKKPFQVPKSDVPQTKGSVAAKAKLLGAAIKIQLPGAPSPKFKAPSEPAPLQEGEAPKGEVIEKHPPVKQMPEKGEVSLGSAFELKENAQRPPKLNTDVLRNRAAPKNRKKPTRFPKTTSSNPGPAAL